ncbi:TrmH family RNA methyltransferase, partial [Muriicola sp.]|uniref:TrmH family RNA methyltransferase n=1 Tax=Muriicola sp. TaxID=2020856 RepID=UPI003C76D5D2
TKECIKTLKANGYKILATTPDRAALPLNQVEINQKMAFLFGAEKEGLTTVAIEEADELIHIPIVGFTESLNVSVAAAILLQQMSTKLRQSDLPWQLNTEEKEKKRLEWIRKSIKNIDQILARYHK